MTLPPPPTYTPQTAETYTKTHTETYARAPRQFFPVTNPRGRDKAGGVLDCISVAQKKNEGEGRGRRFLFGEGVVMYVFLPRERERGVAQL
jgi:hypothetical protein